MTIRVGFLGAGLIAAYHAIQLNLADEPSRIVAVFDPDVDRAAALAGGQGARVVATEAEVIAASDAVFVCTWTSEHLAGIRMATSAGLPVFCEKPLAGNLGVARQLADLVVASGAPDMVGLVLRSSPALLALREMIRDPGSGRVMSVVFRDDQYLPTQGLYDSTWRADVDRAGSGVLLEHSIHDLDLLEWLIGPIGSVAARQAFFHGLDGIEDSVSVLVGFTGGATGTLASVWHDVLSRPSQRRIEVICERAVVTLESDASGPVTRQTSTDEMSVEGEGLIEWLNGRGVATDGAEQTFLAAVRNAMDGGSPARLRPDVTDALRAHVVADAVYRSAAADGHPVAVPPGSGS